MTLIQLVSEQTMQNLLPVLRLKPTNLLHIATPRTVSRSEWVVEASRQANHFVSLRTLKLSEMPGMAETMNSALAEIDRAMALKEEIVLNFTGGTKLMSIGAYVAALKRKVISIYVDTQDGLFVDGQTGGGLGVLLDGDYSFNPILNRLTVHVVSKVNGSSRITGGKDWKPFLPLATHLMEHADEEEAVHKALHGSGGLVYQGQPRNASQWLALCDKEIALPSDVCRLSIESGLFRSGVRPNTVRLPDGSLAQLTELSRESRRSMPGFYEHYRKAVDPLTQSISFLSGGWWEVIVVERMNQSGKFRDLRWSVEIGDRRGPNLEEDIVALRGVEAVYVSCKRTSLKSRLLPLLDEIHARARSLGGAFTKKYLAVRYRSKGKVWTDLEKKAAQLNIVLITGDQIDQSDLF